MLQDFREILGLKAESKNILSFVQKNGPISKKSLANITGYKLTTLNRFMKTLLELNLIEEIGNNESTGGRPSIAYDVNLNDFYVIGVDISRLYTKVCITNLKMKIVHAVNFKMNKNSTPKNVTTRIAGIIKEFKKENNSKIILGIGIGTVGPILREKGIMLNPINFPSKEWYNVNIVKMLKDEINLPAILDNGANSAVLSEYYFGSGTKHSNIAYLNCGIGIRTGVIVSDKIIRTINDNEDSFAHMIIDLNGEPCNCGTRGCIESICSIPSIIYAFQKKVKNGEKTLITKPLNEVDYIDICKAAEASDETASKVILEAAEALGIGIVNFIKILNLDYIIMNGPLVTHSTLFYNNVVTSVMDNYYKAYKNAIYFSRGGYFDQNSIAVGGSVNFIESLLNNPCPS